MKAILSLEYKISWKLMYVVVSCALRSLEGSTAIYRANVRVIFHSLRAHMITGFILGQVNAWCYLYCTEMLLQFPWCPQNHSWPMWMIRHNLGSLHILENTILNNLQLGECKLRSPGKMQNHWTQWVSVARTSLSCLPLMAAWTMTGESITCVNFTVSGCCRYFFCKTKRNSNVFVQQSQMKHTHYNEVVLTSLQSWSFFPASYSGVIVWGKKHLVLMSSYSALYDC